MTDKRALELAKFCGVHINSLGTVFIADWHGEVIDLVFNPFSDSDVSFSQDWQDDIMIGMITRGLVAKGLRVKLDLSLNMAEKNDFVVFIRKPHTNEWWGSSGEKLLPALAKAAYQAMQAEE